MVSQKHHNIYNHKLHALGKMMYPLVHFIRQCKQKCFSAKPLMSKFPNNFLSLSWTPHKDVKSLLLNICTAVFYLIKVITIFSSVFTVKEKIWSSWNVRMLQAPRTWQLLIFKISLYTKLDSYKLAS